MRKTRPLIAALLLSAATAAPAFAQTPTGQTSAPSANTRIRGTVADLAGDTLSVAGKDGGKVTVALAADTRITGVVKLTLADIKPGDFVAVGAVRSTAGQLRALQVNITPGGGDRAAENGFQGPWAPAANGVMTNANVAGIEGAAGAADGRTLKLTYKGGTAEILIPPDAFIASYVPADRTLLKVGADVSVNARKGADGGLTATTVQAEKDGVKLPPL